MLIEEIEKTVAEVLKISRELFGDQFVVYQVHRLRHLPSAIKRHVPPAHSSSSGHQAYVLLLLGALALHMALCI